MIDLKDLTPKSDEIIVTLKHPATDEPLKNKDGTDMTITVWSPHSKQHKAVVYEQTNKRLKKMQSKGGNKDITAEELDEATVGALAKSTKEWNITFGGEMPKLTVTKAREIYEEVFWIRSQIEEAVEDSLDFMKA